MINAEVVTSSQAPGAWIPWLWVILPGILRIACFAGTVYLAVLLVKALRKYLYGKQDPETVSIRKTLGEAIREHRTRCCMTQEFVAEQLGVSRQAVSKWENGASDPSTANLLGLAKLFEVDVQTLLKDVR